MTEGEQGEEVRRAVHRDPGKVVAGTAVAVAGAAAAVAVGLPGRRAPTSRAAPGGTRGAGAVVPGQDAAAPGVVEADPAAGAKGTGTDPLTGDETRRAEAAALSGQQVADGTDVEGHRGPQRLGAGLAAPETDELGRGPAADAGPPAGLLPRPRGVTAMNPLTPPQPAVKNGHERKGS